MEAWKKTGKKLDMGKACMRFKRIEDVPLEVVGEASRRGPAKRMIELCDRARADQATKSTAKSTTKLPERQAKTIACKATRRQAAATQKPARKTPAK